MTALWAYGLLLLLAFLSATLRPGSSEAVFLWLQDLPWFPLEDAMNARAQVWFARYGIWALLLTLVAGAVCAVSAFGQHR